MNTLKELITILLAMAGAFAVLLFIATLAGTIVWILWPIVIPNVFPKLVVNGYIALEISWWHAVCLTWLCGILLSGSNYTTKEDK